MPCDLYYDRTDFSYGNIKESNFYEIWKGQRRQDVIARICEKGTTGCKEGCRMDAINIDLWKLKNGQVSLEDFIQVGEPPAHVNFI